MNKDNLLIATSVGLILQLVMVVAGHYMPSVKDKFAVGGMLISLVAGALYLRLAQQAWPGALSGGALAGGICALLAILVSVGLKDVPATILVIGTGASVVTGLIGGAIAKLV
jgi:hypothetical protein